MTSFIFKITSVEGLPYAGVCIVEGYIQSGSVLIGHTLHGMSSEFLVVGVGMGFHTRSRNISPSDSFVLSLKLPQEFDASQLVGETLYRNVVVEY